MRVLMISIDRSLLGKNQLGDAVERHKQYGQRVERLDIIVFSKKGSAEYKIFDTVVSYPTNSRSKLSYYVDALKLGRKLFDQHHYDLVITQDPFLTGMVGATLKKLLNVKLLVHFHGDF